MDQSTFGHDPIGEPTQPPGAFDLPAPGGSPWPSEQVPQAHWSPIPAVVAWLIIIGMTIAVFVVNIVSKEPKGSNAEDPVGVILMELQGKYLVGAASMNTAQAGMLLSAAEQSLNKGSIDQRQRMVILAGELGGDEAADRILNEFNSKVLLLEGAEGTERIDITADQQRVQQLLIRIYVPSIDANDMSVAPSTRAERIQDLPESDRDFLIKKLGWYGKLALAPADVATDQALRDDVLGTARTVFILLIGIVIAACGGGLVGLAGLIVFLIFAFKGRINSGLGAAVSHHGVYAETFALWILVFFGIQKLLPIVAGIAPGNKMLVIIGGFFVSLFALLWPVLRGVPWRQVRLDIGWTFGKQPALEPLTGLGGYLMALPMLGVGVCITLVLILIQEAIKGEGPAFSPAGGPAHPIFEQLGGSGLWPKIQILLLASIAAPIIEETMFRGVLYRHLRDATRGWGAAMSIAGAGTISSFLFAAIHPQGWVAIPALMSLAYAFVLVREWRGTLIPAMIIHGVSNGIVMTMLMVLLST